MDFNQLKVIKCLRVAGKYSIVNGLIEQDKGLDVNGFYG